jgi:outer membrane protein OmpA-like peptidoglycan-associated protein
MTSTVRVHWVLGAVLILLTAPPVSADEGHVTEIRDYAGETRGYSGETRTIVGINAGLEGNGRGIEAKVISFEAAMTELEAQATETEIIVGLSADVLFDFDKAEIRPQATPELRKVEVIIREKAKGMVTVIGHTDAKGADDYNQRLSEQRAKSVRNWLVENGNLSSSIFLTRGIGEMEPIAPNTNEDGSDNPQGRQLNRRVEIIIQTVQ